MTYRDPDHTVRSERFMEKFLKQHQNNTLRRLYWQYQNQEQLDWMKPLNVGIAALNTVQLPSGTRADASTFNGSS